MKLNCVVALAVALAVNLHAAVVKQPAIIPRYAGAEIGEWTMDHDTALAKAKDEGRNVVVFFTGAWWCPHCQALEDKVLTQPAWQEYVASNQLYLVMMDFPGRADQYWCWLRETNYVESVGLTLAEGEAEITRRYGVQTSYAIPGAPTNAFGGYLRVGYPTLIVLRPDGSRLGRFSPLTTTVSMDMALRNMNQILAADANDEADNFYQGAQLHETPACEDEEHAMGENTLSETDTADWFAVDAPAGVQWVFGLRETELAPTGMVKVQVFTHPTNAVSLIERTMVPSALSVLPFVTPQAGRYWLKISSAQALNHRIGYALSCWYGVSPADVFFSVPQVSVSERAPSVALTVKIANAQTDAEVRVGYETFAGSAAPNEDYVPVTGELVWGPGVKLPKTLTVPLLLDAAPVWEGNETFGVRLFTIKNCSIGDPLAACEVVLTESSIRQAGKLGFEGETSALLREGSNAVFRIVRADGADGAVTARVEHILGSVRTPVAELVWDNRETGAKTFEFGFAAEAGYQADKSSALRLTPLGGASLLASARATVSLTRRDDLVLQTLPEFCAVPANQAFGFRSAYGYWFYGCCGDAERDTAWLRCAPVSAGGTAMLAAKVNGPGVLSFDWRLAGAGSTLRALIGTSVKETLEVEGSESGVAMAVPTGAQTVYWSVKRAAAASATDVFGAVKAIVWTALPQAASPCPSDRAAVINRNLRLSWADVLAAVGFPAGVTAQYELFAGTSSTAMSLLSAQGPALFPRDGNAEDQAAFDALIAKANAKPVYWRVDTVLTDPSGQRAVYKGSTWSMTVLPEGSPELVASEGSYDPTQPAGVALPETAIGVYAEFGPFAVSAAAGDTVAGVVKNGALPSGMKLETRGGALWITGVPVAVGAGAADLHVIVRRTAGTTVTTVPGSSVRVSWTVVPLGRAAGQFNGLVLEGGSPGCGSATLAVSTVGRITGKLFAFGNTYAFTASHFQGKDRSGFFANAVATYGTNKLNVAITVADEGEYALLGVDGLPGQVYELWRNNWSEPGMASVLGGCTGYYTAALPVLESTLVGTPVGIGFLTLTIKSDGTVTYSGQMADGAGVSGSAPLLYGPDCCSLEDRVFFYVFATPSGYGRSGHLYGLIYLSPGTEPQAHDNALEVAFGAGLRWSNTNPQSVFGYNPVTGELPNGMAGFTNVLDVTGGYYDRTVDLRAFYAGRTPLVIQSPFMAPQDYDGTQGVSGYVLASAPDPLQLPAVPTAVSTLAFPKSALVMNGTLVDLARSTNAWGMAIVPNRATGVFSGSFKMYYQGLDGSGVLRQKTKSYALRGVFLPVRLAEQPYPDWMGYYLIPDKYRYLGATGLQQSYSFNWSIGFWMGAVPPLGD